MLQLLVRTVYDSEGRRMIGFQPLLYIGCEFLRPLLRTDGGVQYSTRRWRSGNI